uniref:CNH domain-containing protein n=1 Tax=Wuchereria bancrofti TaxID=6293 RepID=A0A1I8EUR0_WUCBA
MFEAYAPTEIATRLEKSIDVSSLVAHGHAAKVYVGSKAGYLLALNGIREGKRGYDLSMCRSFEKKAINELCCIERHDILLCLTDSQLAAHGLSHPFALKALISDVRPISAFCAGVSEVDGILYVAVSARKKIFLYKWLVDEFIKMHFEMSLAFFPDSVNYMVWCGPIISVAVQNEYYYMTVFPIKEDVVNVKKLFDVGSRTENPVIVGLSDYKQIAYCRDNFLFFQEYYGTVSPISEVKFSDAPLNIVYDAPYLLALLGNGKVEIRSVKPTTHIQTIQLNKAMYISTGLRGTVYVGSSSDVWLLDSRPQMRSNVEKLVNEKQFELAVQLAEKCNEIGDKGVVEIKRKAAFNLFCQRRFDEWLEIHAEIKTDVITVIAHFPRLLDSSYQESLKSLLDGQPPDFPENEFRNGLQSLAPYLASVRMEHAKAVIELKKLYQTHMRDADIIERLKNHENVLQVVDTTLLKCYLQSNESLVALLLRLPDNMCIVADSEKVLLEHEKYNELYILYERKGLHRKGMNLIDLKLSTWLFVALTLLMEQAHIEGSPLRGCNMTVEYLQKLGNKHLDLIIEFAAWVLQENLNAGLSIFTCDNAEIRSLDRGQVLTFLTHECTAAVVPYLEHIIYNWNEDVPKFHEALGQHYISKVKQLQRDYINILGEDEHIAPAGEEEGELGEYRCKLQRFLQTSTAYSPEKLLVQLPLYEERALLLGRLKKHQQALAIYTQILKNYKAAEKYCMNCYEPNDPERSKIFLTLLQMYTNPPDTSIVGLMHSDHCQAIPNPNEAVRILKEHSDVFDPVEALTSLPLDYTLKSVWPGLVTILQTAHNRKHTTMIHKSVCDAALKRTLRRKALSHSTKFVVDYEIDCAACGKKIANSAFARYPNGRF